MYTRRGLVGYVFIATRQLLDRLMIGRSEFPSCGAAANKTYLPNALPKQRLTHGKMSLPVGVSCSESEKPSC
jgi:hypothetical protein